MNKLIVAVFDNEDQAFSGLTGLKDLHRNGDITLYDSAVIAKDKAGYTSLKKEPDDVPTGTFVGMFLGGLVGALGGPIGLAAGASLGTMVGATRDIIVSDVDYGFVEQVRQYMIPGKVAVIADIDENWITPVDLTISEHGGIVFRRLKNEVFDDQLERESAEFEAEIKELKAELATARAEHKAALQARIAMAEKSLRETHDLAVARAKKVDAEWHAKYEAMNAQLKDASERKKARIKDQMAKAKKEYEARSAKLKAAQHLVGEALTP